MAEEASVSANLLQGRYEVGDPVGRGAFGTTFGGRDRQTGQSVVIKRLDLRGLPDWKPVEHFEREAKVLRSLDHSGIPRFVDAFEAEGQDGGHVFYIVSERIEGETLQAKIDAGARWTTVQARMLFETLLETLVYLHELSPRVVHRDIKPSNIVVRPDGQPVLVDFGAVRDVAGGGGMTVVGTVGYMPPEQAMGRAEPRSDLYALSATIVHALTHRAPADLPSDGLELQIRGMLGVPDRFAEILQRLLHPDPKRRFPSARAVLEALRNEKAALPAARARPALTASSKTPPLPSGWGLKGPGVPAVPEQGRPMTPAAAQALSYGRIVQTTTPKTVAAVASTLAALIGFSILFKLGLLFPLTMVLLPGVLLAWPAVRKNELQQLYREGEQTRGRVVSASHRGRGQGPLEVRYEFEVDGKPYAGRLVTDDAFAIRHVERNAPIVLVFYLRADPQRHAAILEPELHPQPS